MTSIERFKRVAPVAGAISRIGSVAAFLGTANNVALIVARPPISGWAYVALAFWPVPIVIVNVVVAFTMLAWAKGLRAQAELDLRRAEDAHADFLRDHPERRFDE